MSGKKSEPRNVARRDFMKTAAAAGAAFVLADFGPFVDTVEASDVYYNTLADALNKLPNAFPRTESNIEVLILKKIFSPQEAWLAGQLGIDVESVEAIAKRVGLPVEEARERLKKMAGRELVWGDVASGHYRLAAFVVGIYEAQLWDMDHEFAHLIEEYFDQGGAELMRPQPALHRVIPAQRAVKSEWVLPYDDVKAVLTASTSFRVRKCICRVQQDHIGERRCSFPLKTCLNFSPFKRPPTDRDVSKEEALALLDEVEEIGLVHTVTNVAEGIGYVCNCCGCCCGLLRGITERGIEKSVAAANYYAVIDPEQCAGCGTCIDRCQVKAISKQDDVAVVDRNKCIGCGLCMTGCPFNVARLERKPDNEIIKPPKDFTTWEHERLKDRGLLT